MPAAQKYIPHYTVADYRTWEGDWELWQGIPVSMSPSPFGIHQRVAKNLVFELEKQVRETGCASTVLYEIDWIVSEDTVVRPDVLVVCGDAPEGHVESVPGLVAEIQSESTAARDREAKRDLYDEHGVANYLLIDPAAQTIEAYQRDTSGSWGYQLIDDSISLSICDDCRLELERQSLFR